MKKLQSHKFFDTFALSEHAPSNNLSFCSHGHMVGPKEFFMSSKEKRPKLF